MWLALTFHALVVEHEDIATLAAAVQQFEEAVTDVGVFQLMAWEAVLVKIVCPVQDCESQVVVLLPLVHSSSLVFPRLFTVPSTWLKVVKVWTWCSSWVEQGSSWCYVVPDPVLGFFLPVVWTIFFDLILASGIRPGWRRWQHRLSSGLEQWA